jgi:hypothetical protein
VREDTVLPHASSTAYIFVAIPWIVRDACCCSVLISWSVCSACLSTAVICFYVADTYLLVSLICVAMSWFFFASATVAVFSSRWARTRACSWSYMFWHPFPISDWKWRLVSFPPTSWSCTYCIRWAMLSSAYPSFA